MPGKKTIQNEQLAARGNAPRVSFANENRGRNLIRKDGVAVVPLGDVGGKSTRARHIRARTQ
jgi:hypothetical protein